MLPTSETTLQLNLANALGHGLFKGLLHRKRTVAEAEAVTASSLDQRLAIAKQLVAMDLTDHPAEGRDQRLANLGQLMEATVFAAAGRGQNAHEALVQANRQRDVLFASARGLRHETERAVVDTAMTLKAAVLQGQLMAGADLTGALGEARLSEETCLKVARRLSEVNQATYPDLHGEVRLTNAAKLFAAALTGELGKGRPQPTASLVRDLYDKHAPLFLASAQRAIEGAMAPAAPRPSLGQALNVAVPTSVPTGSQGPIPPRRTP